MATNWYKHYLEQRALAEARAAKRETATTNKNSTKKQKSVAKAEPVIEAKSVETVAEETPVFTFGQAAISPVED